MEVNGESTAPTRQIVSEKLDFTDGEINHASGGPATSQAQLFPLRMHHYAADLHVAGDYNVCAQ